MTNLLTLILSLTFLSCQSQTAENLAAVTNITSLPKNLTQFDTTYKTIYIFVALCDNTYQGIVPVPAKIGNGQDPFNNLYWGCAFGIRTYFKNSTEWKLVKSQKIDTLLMERIVFKHVTKNYYLVADAYNGKYIKHCTEEFLRSSSGLLKDTIHVNNKTIGIAGNAKLVSYIGHDGLMDFKLTETFQNTDNKKRDVIILACYSKSYFTSHLKAANVTPLVWTTGLMCTEAYTIHDAITGYINNETNEAIRTRAALAYSKYQKCSVNAARNLLVTGW
jgi:hypothetical protein